MLTTRRGRLWATDPREQLLPVKSICDVGDTCEMQREPQKGPVIEYLEPEYT